MNTQLKKTLAKLPELAQDTIRQIEQQWGTPAISISRPNVYLLDSIPSRQVTPLYQGDQLKNRINRIIRTDYKVFTERSMFCLSRKVIDFLECATFINLNDVKTILSITSDTHYPVVCVNRTAPFAWITVYLCNPGLRQAVHEYWREKEKRDRFIRARKELRGL